MRKPRKNSTPVGKDAILRRHLIDRVPVSDLCDEHQLSPMLSYLWQKQFFESGTSTFERKNGAPESHYLRTIAALREKLQRKKVQSRELTTYPVSCPPISSASEVSPEMDSAMTFSASASRCSRSASSNATNSGQSWLTKDGGIRTMTVFRRCRE